MKKVLKILSGVLFVALLVGTFWFLWRKTRPVKILYAIVQPATDTLKQYVFYEGTRWNLNDERGKHSNIFHPDL